MVGFNKLISHSQLSKHSQEFCSKVDNKNSIEIDFYEGQSLFFAQSNSMCARYLTIYFYLTLILFKFAF
jgi:hypothetical protein